MCVRAVVDSEPTAGEGTKGTADGSSPNGQVGKPLEKPPEVVAFEAGKEIMDLLRSKHPHSTGALELMMSEIGAHCCPPQTGGTSRQEPLFARFVLTTIMTACDDNVRIMGCNNLAHCCLALLYGQLHTK